MCYLISAEHECPYFLSRKTTTKGTGLTESTEKEDTVVLNSIPGKRPESCIINGSSLVLQSPCGDMAGSSIPAGHNATILSLFVLIGDGMGAC